MLPDGCLDCERWGKLVQFREAQPRVSFAIKTAVYLFDESL